MALKECEDLRKAQRTLDAPLAGEANRVVTLQRTQQWLQRRLDVRRTDSLLTGQQRADWLMGSVSPMFAHAAFRLEMLAGNECLCVVDPMSALIVSDDDPVVAWFASCRRWVRMQKHATVRDHLEKLQMGESYHRMVWHDLGPVLTDLADLAEMCTEKPSYSLAPYRLLANASALLALSMYFCDVSRDWTKDITAAHAFDTLNTKFTAYAAR